MFLNTWSYNSKLKSKIVKNQLYKLFLEYVKENPQANESGASRGKVDLAVSSIIWFLFFISKNYLIYLYILIHIFHLESGFVNFDNVGVSSCATSKLDKCLDECRRDYTIDLNILSWWKINKNWFPSLINMAWDILSTPNTIVGFKPSFSMKVRILTKHRASLRPKNAKALVTNHSWLLGYKIDEGKSYK